MTFLCAISYRGDSSHCTSWYYILQGDIVGIQANADSCRTEEGRELSGSSNPEITNFPSSHSQVILFLTLQPGINIIMDGFFN